MDTNYNTPEHDDLQQMREQIATLRSKLVSQQIVSEKMILQTVKKGVGNINRRGILFSFFGLFAIIYCCWAFSFTGFSRNFIIGTAVMLAICMLATIYIHLGLQVADLSRGNMLEVRKRVALLRKRYVYWHLWSVPMIFVWGYFLYHEIEVVMPNEEMRIALWIGALIGGLIGGGIGLWQHFKVLRMADEVLQSIEELQE